MESLFQLVIMKIFQLFRSCLDNLLDLSVLSSTYIACLFMPLNFRIPAFLGNTIRPLIKITWVLVGFLALTAYLGFKAAK